jgi:hypothetical protein
VWPHQPAPPQEEAEVIYSPSAGAQSSTEEDKNVGAFFGGLLRRTRLIGSGKCQLPCLNAINNLARYFFPLTTLILGGTRMQSDSLAAHASLWNAAHGTRLSAN